MNPSPAQLEPSERLRRLTLPEGYRRGREDKLPSETSLQWVMRTKRERLVKAGALVKINGRVYIDPPRFDAVLLESGEEDMKAALNG